MHILAIDVGTSAVKAAVLEHPSARPITHPAKAAYDLDHPTPDAAEIPPNRLWDAVASAARQAIASAPGVAIEGVGLSCLTPALVLLDDEDRPLAPIWIHLDRRARPLARTVWQDVGEEFLYTVGNRPLPGGMSALCYGQLTVEEPQLRRRVRHYLHANGWIALRLTGERAFDPGNASFSGLFNTVTNREWSPRWCDYFGVDREWLPKVVCGSTTLGGLRAAIAAEWGLPPGIPVKLGTADTSSAVLSAEMRSGDLLHVVGTTQVLATLPEYPVPDQRRLTRMLGVGDAYVYVTHNPVGGVALEWLHQLAFRDVSPDSFFADLVPQAMARATQVDLDPLFLGGDRLEIEPRFAAFRGLSLTTDRLDLLAAVLNGMRAGHRAAYAALDRAELPDRVFLTGGGADVVRQLLPEYGTTQVHRIEEGSLRGVARLFDAR